MLLFMSAPLCFPDIENIVFHVLSQKTRQSFDECVGSLHESWRRYGLAAIWLVERILNGLLHENAVQLLQLVAQVQRARVCVHHEAIARGRGILM